MRTAIKEGMRCGIQAAGGNNGPTKEDDMEEPELSKRMHTDVTTQKESHPGGFALGHS